MLKTCQFKTWFKGDESNKEHSTGHFCEDTRQNALAVLTNLDHGIGYQTNDCQLVYWVVMYQLIGSSNNEGVQTVKRGHIGTDSQYVLSSVLAKVICAVIYTWFIALTSCFKLISF